MKSLVNKKNRLLFATTVLILLTTTLFPLSINAEDRLVPSILIPPDPEDLINGYALVEEVPLTDFDPKILKARINYLRTLPDSELNDWLILDESAIPEINFEKLGIKDLHHIPELDDMILMVYKLNSLPEIEIPVQQIRFAEELHAEITQIAKDVLQEENFRVFAQWNKLRSDLLRVIQAASIAMSAVLPEIEYEIDSQYIRTVPENIRVQLSNEKVRFSELKRLNVAVHEFIFSQNKRWNGKPSLLSDRLLTDTMNLKKIRVDLFETIHKASTGVPVHEQKIIDQYFDSSRILEYLDNNDKLTYNHDDFDNIYDELLNLKGSEFFPETLTRFAQRVLESGQTELNQVVEGLLQEFTNTFPQYPETQLAYIQLGKIETIKIRPDIDRAIALFQKGKNWPSMLYRAEATLLEAEWRFAKEDSVETEVACKQLANLIRNQVGFELDSELFEKAVSLLSRIVIEGNSNDFEKNRPDIVGKLDLTEAKLYNQAIETIYLETLFEIYPNVPEVSRIIQNQPSKNPFNPRLELLKIKSMEAIDGDLYKSYSMRKSLQLALKAYDENTNKLLINDLNAFSETLHYQIFELAVLLTKSDREFLSNVAEDGAAFLQIYPESSLAARVVSINTDLVYSFASTKAEKLDSYRGALESLKYLEKDSDRIEVTSKVIARILNDGFQVPNDISDNEIVSLLSDKNPLEFDRNTSFDILIESLRCYLRASTELKQDSITLPLVATGFANRGFFLTAGHLYRVYIELNPSGEHIRKVIDGYFSVNLNLENYDDLEILADLIIQSGKYSDDIKDQVRQYKSELEILLARKQGKKDEAKNSKQILEHALKENPSAGSNASALFELALKAEEENRNQDALDYFLTLIDIYPESQLLPEAAQNYAYLLEKKMRSEVDEGLTSVTREDIGYAFLKAARCSDPGSRQNSLYLRALEYFKYTDETENELEAIRGFHKSNDDESKKYLALDKYSSILWRMKQYAELDSMAEVMMNSDKVDLSSMGYLYKLLLAIEKRDIIEAKKIREDFVASADNLDKIEKRTVEKLTDVLTALIIEKENETVLALLKDKKPISIDEYNQLKTSFEGIRSEFDSLMQLESVNSIATAIKLAEYEKRLANKIKKKAPSHSSHLQNTSDQNQRLNLAIEHQKNAINRLVLSRQKLDLIQAVYDTMVFKTGRTRDFYWDFLGIYSYGIINKYPSCSEQKILDDQYNKIGGLYTELIGETLTDLQKLIRNFLDARSPGRDELAVIYFDYSVLNELVLPRFEITTNLYSSIGRTQTELPGQIDDFVNLFDIILQRSMNQQNRIFLNQYEPKISEILERMKNGDLLQQHEIDLLLDLQELLNDFIVNGLEFSRLILSLDLNDELLEESMMSGIEEYLNVSIEQVQRSARISNDLRNSLYENSGDENYLVEDLLMGNLDIENRILRSLWSLLENNPSVTSDIRQNCLIEMAIREPAKYIYQLGLSGKEEFIVSPEDIKPETENGTSDYVVQHSFPMIYDDVNIEIRSNSPYELFVNNTFAAEGEGTQNEIMDLWDIRDLILPGKENVFRVSVNGEMDGISHQVVLKIYYNSYLELEMLINMLHKGN